MQPLPCAYTILIPARMASSRLPGKPLADLGGLPMVVRVAQRVSAGGAARVVVAADDARIVQACAAHGVQAVATDAAHASGSDRLAQASTLLALPDEAIVVNVQGDEPLIDLALPAAVAHLLHAKPLASMATAACALDDASDWRNPNVVKLVCDAQGMALYFSRAPIPWWRDAPAPTALCAAAAPLRHVGIYAYRAGFLRQFAAWAPTPLEECEALEQLRALWHGHRIAVHTSAHAPAAGVDTPADLQRVRALLAQEAAQ